MALGSTRCLAACPSGQVAGVDSNCLLCDLSCDTCSGSTYTCTACKSGFLFSGSNPGPCVNSCPVGTYADTTDCTTCVTGCATCFGGGVDGSGNGVQCTTCTGSYYLAIGSTSCLGTCPSGQTAGANNNCVFCDVSCSVCTSSTTTCSTCKTGYVFVSANPGPCINSCPVGKYMGSTACTACPGGCKTCFGGGVDSNGDGI